MYTIIHIVIWKTGNKEKCRKIKKIVPESGFFKIKKIFKKI